MTPSDIMQAWQAPSDRDGLDATQMARLLAPFEQAGWYRALTLEERITSLRAAAQHVITPDTPTTERRQPPWPAQPPFGNPAIWAQRLAADGMTDAEFERLVNEPIECVRDRVPAPPAWLTDLAAAFSHPFSSVPLPLPEHFRHHPLAGLLHPAQPLLCQGLERLRAGIADLVRRYPSVPFDPATIEEILFAVLPARVIRMMSRTAALEVNVLRLQGLLEGDTPEERFRHFAERLALRGPQEVNWLGLTMTSARHGEVTPLDLDLYDGMPGVALFLAYLGALSGVERYTALAHATCATMRRTVREHRAELTWIGGFVGWGGILYTLTHLGVLWRQPQLLDEAEEIVELLPALIDQDEQLDVVSGAAGCLVPLLNLHEARPCQSTLAAAMQCGDRLIARAQPVGDGLCWQGPRLGPLAGFSHGAAGIAWALLALFARTGAERLRTAARGGIAYERSVFSAEAGNWRDLRDTEHVRFPTAWCHGAPGIGLARLCGVPLLEDDGIRADIATALQTTLATGFGFNHSLCHGDLGNLELLLRSGEPSWRDTAYRLAGAVLDSARQHGWRCGTPMEVESPGLMTGLAGIGYGLLRLTAPARVPSVLTLEGPRGAQEDLWQ